MNGTDTIEPPLGGDGNPVGGGASPLAGSRSARMRNIARSSVRNVNSLVIVNKEGLEPLKEEDGEVEEDGSAGCCGRMCQIMSKYPISFVLAGAAIGIGTGIGLSMWHPDDPQVKSTVLLWVGLLGDLFIRALKCIVLPLVFVSIAVSGKCLRLDAALSDLRQYKLTCTFNLQSWTCSTWARVVPSWAQHSDCTS